MNLNASQQSKGVKTDERLRVTLRESQTSDVVSIPSPMKPKRPLAYHYEASSA